MNIFPILNDDRQLREAVQHKTEIRFAEQPNGTTVCSYVISCQGTFDDHFSREARGVVFDKNGKVIARPLHKFFNVNERPETQINNLDWSKVTRVMYKRDGSMIHTAAVKNQHHAWPDHWNFDLKSKKSYTSDVAHGAKTFLMFAHEAGQTGIADLCAYCVENGLTAIFEWTSPTARIVVYYESDGLKLLHVRDNVTGEYLKQDALEELCTRFNVPLVENADDVQKLVAADPTNLLQLVETVEGIEGWVFQFENGDMVKLKTKWYCERHRAMTFLRERDIAYMTLKEELDDLKALLVDEGADISEILTIERRVVDLIDELITDVESTYVKVKDLPRKEVAIKYGPAGENYLHFSLLMQKFSGMEPDYKGYFESKFLKEKFGLNQLNLMQSVAEVE